VCLTLGGDPQRTTDATTAWLRRYLRRDTSAATGPRVEVIDQHGVRFTGPDWPLAPGVPLRGSGSGTLTLTAEGGAGPATAPAGSTNPVSSVAARITPAKATNAVNVPVTAKRATFAVGAPRLTITYSGTTPAGTRPTRVFAQLVDDTTGIVLDNQITPVPVVLDGRRHTLAIPLEMISQSFAAGASVTLQLVPTTVAYATPRLGGSVDFSRIGILLPTAAKPVKVS
jgi:ABC-2 type transport system ATP-binding protein